MKKILILLSLLFSSFTYADTINLHWLNEDGTTYQNSTCVIDSDLILPSTPPTKYGYTFTGWKLSNYIPIEYIESTGTQYIDTGVYPNDDLGCEVGYLIPKFDSSWHTIFSARNSDNNKQFGMNYYTYDRCSIEKTYSGDNRINFTTYPGQYSELTFRQNTVTKPNGTSTQMVSTGPFVGNYRIYIFALNQGGSISEYGVFKLYFLKLYDADVLIRDFIPALDLNGTPCLYDRVTEQFYYNQGTGQFIAGPVITE